MIIVLHGLPGVGKSTISKKLKSITNGVVLGTNQVRREVLEHKAYAYGSTETFPFSREDVYKSYKIMLYAASLLAEHGKHVILDATFQKYSYIDMAKEAAKKGNTTCFVLKVICDENVCKARIEERVRLKQSDSIVGYEHHKEMKEKIFEEYIDAHFTFDTSKEPKEQWKNLKNLLLSFT